MIEPQKVRVKREAMKVVRRAVVPIDGARPVLHVADERVVDMAHVAPHLMQTAGLGERLYERASVDGRAADETKAREGRDARAVFGFGHGVIDDPRLRRRAAHESEITLLHSAVLDGARELCRGDGVAREQQRAARSAIEPVDRMHVVAAEGVTHAEEGDIVVVVPPAVDEQTGRLVHHHENVVDVENLDRSIICGRPSAGLLQGRRFGFGASFGTVKNLGHGRARSTALSGAAPVATARREEQFGGVRGSERPITLNPYAAPRGPEEPFRAAFDSVDLFVETLPPPVLRAAIGVLIGIGFTMLVLFVRMTIVVAWNPTGVVLAASHMVMALVAFIVAWGVREGRIWLAVVGFALSPLVGVASLFALYTRSIAGLVGGTLALANVGLLVASLAAVETIGRAKAELARVAARDARVTELRAPRA